MRDLPEPTTSRWQPLRAGLVDLFYYDNEEFFFRDGRLLLRGNNGTGKSKVLALTLPFLLDGDLGAHRVEPDADPKKRMEWNLLLGGEHPYPERLGYTWLEFGRLDLDGTPHFRTLGCGMKAVSGRGIARHWFFVTSLRPGADLDLIDATGTALTRERLIEALGDSRAVYDRARDYRRAVDENLFGFGEQRYGALVDLLVQLRQPQLSKRPSERALSAALTEALPPLDQAVLADVADAFRSLEDDRDELAAMTEARDAAQGFLRHYSHYARVAARRKAVLPREAESAYRRVREDLNAAEAAHTTAIEALRTAEGEYAELVEASQRLTERERVLRDSPEMRSARDLQQAAEEARMAVAAVESAEAERERSQDRVSALTARHETAASRLSSARAELSDHRESTAQAAGAARLDVDHRALIDRKLDDDPDVDALRTEAADLAKRQSLAVKHVIKLAAAAEQAARELADARARVTGLQTQADELAERRAGAAQTATDEGTALVTAVREHVHQSTELRLADAAATLAELELWVETLDGPSPAQTAVHDAAARAAEVFATEDAAAASSQAAVEERRSEKLAEIERLERGEDTVPPAPYTRDEQSRAGRPGAPLWRLIDFAAPLSDEERAGLEAALEAAGILDAWVTPDGELLAEGTDDVLLRAGDKAVRPVTEVLRPAVDRDDEQAGAVSDTTVSAVLAAIGLAGDMDAGPTWVSIDGRFRNGVLTGSWHKPAAVYVGRGAREAARRARLSELRDELAVLDAELAELQRVRATITGRKAELRREVAALPNDDDLRSAHTKVAALAREAELLDGQLARAAQQVTAATEASAEAAAALTDAASGASLPTDPAELDAVAEAVQEYRLRRLTELWHAVGKVREAAQRAAETADDLSGATTTLARHEDEFATARQTASAAEERHRTLRETVGAAVAELERRLAAVVEDMRANERAQEAARKRADGAREDKGKAEGRRETLGAELVKAAERRSAATEALRRFAGTGLLSVAVTDIEFPDPELDWAPEPTVRLARRVNDELADVTDDDPAWERAQRRLNDELKSLQDTLSRQGNRAVADLREDGVVVEVEFRGKPVTVPAVADALAAEVAEREQLLNEREREVLENHLIGEVASTLHELIAAAEDQVAVMNGELERRPTSTGMRLRLLWQPREDGPPGLAEARKRLLRQHADAWSEADRAAVGTFLQERIEEVRAQESGRTWLEQLTEALDYRSWNRFVIQRHQNGQWRSASGPASGGERVLAASVPLFAAASAHFASAGNPHAPRIVTLDEAFAGVDDNARAKYLGLLATFDLDVVMTSEREWGCYPEVPGLAISQLSRVDGVPAVLVTNWEWDGNQRVEVERRIRPAAEPRVEVPAEGLFE